MKLNRAWRKSDRRVGNRRRVSVNNPERAGRRNSGPTDPTRPLLSFGEVGHLRRWLVGRPSERAMADEIAQRRRCDRSHAPPDHRFPSWPRCFAGRIVLGSTPARCTWRRRWGRPDRACTALAGGSPRAYGPQHIRCRRCSSRVFRPARRTAPAISWRAHDGDGVEACDRIRCKVTDASKPFSPMISASLDFPPAVDCGCIAMPRKLPVGETAIRHSVWVSEIMLQQRRWEGHRLFRRFLTAFPTIESLPGDEHESCDCGKDWATIAAPELQQPQNLCGRTRGRFPRDRRSSAVCRRRPLQPPADSLDRPSTPGSRSLSQHPAALQRLLAYDEIRDRRGTSGLLWAMAEAVLPRRGSGRNEPSAHGVGERSLYGRGRGAKIVPSPCSPRQSTRPATRNSHGRRRSERSPRCVSCCARPPPRPSIAAAMAGRAAIRALWIFPRFPITSDRPPTCAANWPRTYCADGVVIAPVGRASEVIGNRAENPQPRESLLPAIAAAILGPRRRTSTAA